MQFNTCHNFPLLNYNFCFIIYGHLSENENVTQVPFHIRNNSTLSLSHSNKYSLHSMGIKEAVNSTTADFK